MDTYEVAMHLTKALLEAQTTGKMAVPVNQALSTAAAVAQAYQTIFEGVAAAHSAAKKSPGPPSSGR